MGTACSCNDHCGAPPGVPLVGPPSEELTRAPQQALAEHLRSRVGQDKGPTSQPEPEQPIQQTEACEGEADFVGVPPPPEPVPEPGPAAANSSEITQSAPNQTDNCEGPDKPAQQAPCPSRIEDFKVSLRGSQGSSLGFDYIPAEDGSSTLMVTDVLTAGAAVDWNAEQLRLGQAALCLQRGDRITGVAGTTGNREAMNRLLTALVGASQAVECDVERWPNLIPVCLHRREPTDRLGIQVELIERADKQKVLRIGRIFGGLLGDWNQRAVASRRFADAVMPGSEIHSVGAVSGDPERMRDEVMRQEKVELVFRRLDPEICKRMSQQIQSLKAETGAERASIPVSAG